mgnify:CR=1 FL=1
MAKACLDGNGFRPVALLSCLALQVLGNKVIRAFPIEDVLDYIDWNPFFQVRAGQAAADE